MLVTNANNEQSLPQDVGLTAFRVAVVQQRAFEETLERVSEKQSRESEDIERKAEASREQQARDRGGVDIVVRDDEGAEQQQATPQNTGDAVTDSVGSKVDVAV